MSALSTDPDEYMCYVDCIMQETSVWCAAATVQQTLSTIDFYHSDISITIPSQQSIMNTLGSGRALQPILNYINSRQSVNQYIKTYYNNESGLLHCLSYAAYNNTPTILHMSANSTNVSYGYWPYTTNGHYTNLDGKTYDGRWVISDPYYYEHYIPNAEHEGFHFRTYEHIATVNGNKYGSDNKTIAY